MTSKEIYGALSAPWPELIRAVEDTAFRCGEWDSNDDERYSTVHDRSTAALRALTAEIARLTAALARAEERLTATLDPSDVLTHQEEARVADLIGYDTKPPEYQRLTQKLAIVAQYARDAARTASDPAPAAPGGGA